MCTRHHNNMPRKHWTGAVLSWRRKLHIATQYSDLGEFSAHDSHRRVTPHTGGRREGDI